MDPCTRQDPLLLETTSVPLTLCGCWICAFCVDRTWREYSRYLTTTHETFKILSFLDRYRQQVSKIHHDASYLLFQIKHLSLGIKKHFCSRPVPSLLAIQWIHQARPSCTLSSAWRREPGHFRSPQNPHWSKQVGTLWTKINCTWRQWQISASLVFPRRQRMGYAFLRCPDNDPRCHLRS